MKSIGAKMEYSDERICDLMRAYEEYVSSCSYLRMPELYEAVVNTGTKRFWVSDKRASLVISSMMRGEDALRSMRPLKREMYEEIYRRVVLLRKTRPCASVYELCSEVVAQPAPKFYLTPKSAKVMICKVRKEWYSEKLKKLQRL